MRILIITPYFWPPNSPRAYRWSTISKYLVGRGHDVLVLTANDEKMKVDPHYGDVRQVGMSTPDKMVTSDKSASRNFPMRTWVKKLFQFFMWPDESGWWGHTAILDGLPMVKEFQPEVMISVSWPFSAHLAGRAIHYSLRIPWMVDIGDPFHLGCWPPRNNQWFYKGRNAKIELEILNSAVCPVVTTESLKEIYDEALSSSKCEVIGPMCSPIPVDLKNIRKGSEINIGYFGSLYEGIREPSFLKPFFGGFIDNPKMRQVHFHFYGNYKIEHVKAIRKLADGNQKVTFHAPVSREEVIERMNSMDVLLSLGNLSVTQLPSKIVDYAVTGRPILHITQSPSDPVIDFFKGYDVFKVVDHQNVDIIGLEDFILASREMSASQQFTQVVVENHSAEVISRGYETLIQRIFSGK